LSASAASPKGEKTRQVIVDTAHRLFVEQGYAATSMRQIADQSGLALGGIYNHFSNKEAIFVDVILSRHPFFQVLPLLKSAPGDTVEEFVRNAARSMVAELGRRPDFVKLLFVELVEFEGKNVPKMFDLVYPEVLPLVQRFIDRNGELRNISPMVLFRAFIGLFFSFYMTELLFSSTPLVFGQKNSLDSFVDIFLHGVLAKKVGS
jgi:AcrR family transcriptional regulator